jgi:SAM-dependent methyltransferase
MPAGSVQPMERARSAVHQAKLLYHRLRPRRARLWPALEPSVRDAQAFEIGGPSEIFGRDGLLPLYPVVRRIDNGNFSSETIWDGAMNPAATPGRALVCEATDLGELDTGAYDLLLASHVLEHVANPLLALREWHRVLRPGGTLVMVVPQRERTFDHRRPITTFEHLLADEAAGTGEDDLTHLPEILELHDLSRDPAAGTLEEFELRSRAELRFRALHHHVFDPALAARAVAHAGFEVTGTGIEPPFHIIVLARKPQGG